MGTNPEKPPATEEGSGISRGNGSERAFEIVTPRVRAEEVWNPQAFLPQPEGQSRGHATSEEKHLSQAKSGSFRRPSENVQQEVSDNDEVIPAFDPTILLQEGLDEWQNKNFGLAHMKRNHSFSVRRSWEEGRKSLSRLSIDKREAADRLPTIISPKRDYSLELPKDFYDSLAAAPHAALIHLVILYHQSLWKNGLLSEADSIASALAELRDPEQIIEDQLMGMDLLLKDGLLQYMLRISPYLPPIPRQVSVLSSCGWLVAIWSVRSSTMLKCLSFLLVSDYQVQGPYLL